VSSPKKRRRSTGLIKELVNGKYFKSPMEVEEYSEKVVKRASQEGKKAVSLRAAMGRRDLGGETGEEGNSLGSGKEKYILLIRK